MSFIYLSIDQVIKTHGKTIEVSGGGDTSILEMGKLESALDHIQNDDYYPTFEDKLTHLCFCANKFHSFSDGNKRISISLGAQFLLLNGYVFVVPRFISEMENISYHVAAGKIDKKLLHEIICALIYDEYDNEDLKLKIYDAIKD
ncbi:MAG: type II toxin-antitoxin system death-on-curing family toxin [Candidatus Margulisiibacteriota bacterium]